MTNTHSERPRTTYPKMAPESRAVCRVRPFRRYSDNTETGRSNCSGFLWRYDGRAFLITNWHCVSGINPDNGQTLGSFCPSHAEVHYKAYLPNPAQQDTFLSLRKFVVITLLPDEFDPLWIEHPLGHTIDIVAFPLDIVEFEEEKVLCLNDIGHSAWWQPSVASDCFVTGFPEGLFGEMETPIWKRGSIATEPDFDHAGLPLVLIDSLTNPGLSGSPVIAQSNEIFRNDVPDQTIGPWRSILGVYSGRIGDVGLGLQLGRVWKRRAIDELFLRPKKGELPKSIGVR